MANEAPKTLLDILWEEKLISSEEKNRLQAESAGSDKIAEELILKERLVPEEKLAEARGKLLGVPYINLQTIDVNRDAMKEIPHEAAANYQFVVFDKTDKTLKVAMVNPDDFQALEALKFITKKNFYTLEVYITSPASLRSALGLYETLKVEVTSALKEFEEEMIKEARARRVTTEEVEKIVQEAPVTKAVAVVIKHAIEGRASDIHIEPREKELEVRYRVDGALFTSLILPLKVHPAIISRIKILCNLRIDEQRIPQDGRFSTPAGGREYDFRVAIMPTIYGEKAAIRILDKTVGALSFEELGLEKKGKEEFEKAIQMPHGIVLITGPTGSGKSTTLFSAIDFIKNPEYNIVTLEDPVEYYIEGVNQTQINPDVGLTFGNGLRSILRQDPDIIMVGEIRDRETAEMAVHSSLTGHLVLSTLHTNDAIGAIPRLIDMGIEPFLLAAVMRCVVAQRLVRRICPHCKEEMPIPAEFKGKILAELKSIPQAFKTVPNQKNPTKLYQGKGCKKCFNKGMLGRVAIFEVMPVTEAIREVTLRKGSIDDLAKVARAQGVITMRQDGLLKALAGVTTVQDVWETTAEAI